MPDTSKLSKFLKPEHAKDGDIITFLDAGIIVEKTFKKDGRDETKPVLEIAVKFKGETKTYSPNGTTVKLLTGAWGAATEKWVGKSAVITILPANNGKDMIIAKPKDGKAAPAGESQIEGQSGDEVEEVPF
jgi:hypothetical protein